MVTGKVPFEGETTSDIIAALIKDEPEPMRLTVPELPWMFEEVVNKALQKIVAVATRRLRNFIRSSTT